MAGTNSPAFLPVDLFTIDEKMDDGVPYAGKVQVMGYGPGNGGIMSLVPSGGTPYYPNCVNTGTTPPSYQSSYTTAACIAGFKIGGYGNYYGP